ncbi:MAG TPA: hypothetical protein VGP26_01330 [Actinophytocola sp.]|jgi:hypothetical protein|nr:hypothetical protein [Actinophytocola sp.]
MGWFGAACPVRPREQRWVEASMRTFRRELGPGPLGRPVVLPTPEFFPDSRTGTDADIDTFFRRVCRYAEVDPSAITVETFGGNEEAELARATGLTYESRSAAGDYRRAGGRPVIGVDRAAVDHPARLVATIAHELAHHRLHERGLGEDRADHEPLADLLTVYLGLGVFTANAAFEYRTDLRRRSAHRLGYLTEPMFGYGLACFAWLREETEPDWARSVDANPRSALKRGLRYLAGNAPAGEFPAP